MKRNLKASLLALLALSMCACDGGSVAPSASVPASEDTPSESTTGDSTSVDTSIVDDFEEGDNSHQSEADQTIHTIRFHYHRTDDYGSYAAYRNWQIWAWDIANGGNGAAFDFAYYDDYGVYVDIPLNQIAATGYTTTSKLGFIVAITSTWTKDPDGDRSLDIEGSAPGGILDVYLMTKSDKIYYDPESPLKSSIDYARLGANSDKEIRVVFNISATEPFTFYPDNLSVEVGGTKVTNYTLGDFDDAVTLTFDSSLDLSKKITISYKFDDTWIDSTDMIITSYYDSEEFTSKYTYSGDDLGVTFDDEINPTKTTFKVWAPTSSKVDLLIYNTGTVSSDPDPINTYEMTMGSGGVYSYTVDSDLTNKYYTYRVTNSKGTNEVVDPYAKSAGLNGHRGMVVNFHDINESIAGWSTDTRPNFGSSAVDASIYEIHVRDMTINPNSGVSAANRGDFLGLTETGTTYTENGVTVSTGLDHLKELGVTHVQIQPFYDYSSVDESLPDEDMSDENYNWGYDPQNYNVLEGSYSSDPYDGTVRIKEFKQMVMALHNAGISINMDVVYNHTSSTEQSNFQYLVPYYYYRTRNSGVFFNGSGCGNEVASERTMVNKFIVESTEFWTDEYHLSGYRFDLMGLLDNQTMIDVYDANSAIYDKIMVYGEPWTGGTSKLTSGTDASKLTSQQTVQSSLAQNYFVGEGNYVGAFADSIRNMIRGDNNPGEGWVQGVSGNAATIAATMKGVFNSSQQTVSPTQVLNYVSCHDNYTLYDQLIQSNRNNRDMNDMYLQSETLVFVAQGVPFMQEGEDFMRSKNYIDEEGNVDYEGNSYNVGDYINDMDYSLKITNHDMFESFKELIQLRKDYAQFRFDTRAEIDSRVNTSQVGGNISYTVSSANGEAGITAYFSLSSFNVGTNAGSVIYSNCDTYPVGSQVSGGQSLSLGANEFVIIANN